MKVVVLIPSDAYRDSAGARIRYGRLGNSLRDHGIDFRLEDINAFSPRATDCDVLIVSKCHDAQSLIAAAVVAGRGKLVGVDLFDDYFSQPEDSRLARYRHWLGTILDDCAFALCSTARLARVVEAYRPGVPVHVANDPAPDRDPAELAEVLRAKLAEVRDTKRMRLTWFGVGDSPYFNVGLSDLAAYSAALVPLTRDFDVELTILTNRRALLGGGMPLINSLPVRTVVAEWSEEREQQSLERAFSCFLPVNAQSFSAAKSMNRAVTALSAGCQVLSPAYPLYRSLESLTYADAGALLADVERGSMRLSAEGLNGFQEAMRQFASAEVEAAKLASFLRGLRPVGPALSGGHLALFHGSETTAAAHLAIRDSGGLSVASPYCDARLDFDVIFRFSDGGLATFVSRSAARRLSAAERKTLRRSDINDRRYWLVGSGEQQAGPVPAPQASLPFQLATYRNVLESMHARLDELFGPCRRIVSEDSPYLLPVAR